MFLRKRQRGEIIQSVSSDSTESINFGMADFYANRKKQQPETTNASKLLFQKNRGSRRVKSSPLGVFKSIRLLQNGKRKSALSWFLSLSLVLAFLFYLGVATFDQEIRVKLTSEIELTTTTSHEGKVQMPREGLLERHVIKDQESFVAYDEESGTDDDATNMDEKDVSLTPHYGSLNLLQTAKTRPIVWRTESDPEEEDQLSSEGEDEEEYSVDDDFEEAISYQKECRPTLLETRNHKPACNLFQELDMAGNVANGNAKSIAHGDMTNVFLIDHSTKHQNEKFIFKGIFFHRGKIMDERRWTETRRDAVVGSAAGSHPRIVANYGYCGFNVFQEFMARGNLHDILTSEDPYCREEGDIRDWSKNFPPTLMVPMKLKSILKRPLFDGSRLNVTQKLRISLDMAEATAVLHNNPNGAIVHNDLWTGQFMLDDSGERVKLNDFNTAKFVEFNEQRHAYCPFTLSKPRTDYECAPEDVNLQPSGTERDVFQLANNMYTVLTGMDFYNEVCDFSGKLDLLMADARSFLDPRFENRSYGEGEIFRLIHMCWETNPSDRPSVGDMVRILSEALQNHLEQESEESSSHS